MKPERKDSKEEYKLDPLASELISFVSHQIKSPLGSIKGYADLILMGHYGKIPSEVVEIVTRMRSSAERAIDLSTNLLDLKRIEEGKMQYNFGDADLNEIVKGVVEELKLLADRKRLKLEFSPCETNAVLKADKRHMHQVIQNLVDNAIKYTKEGWVKIEINKSNNKFTIKVSDTGKGISKESLESIFEKFIQEVRSGETIQGTGLGLFIVENVVDAHKGKVWAESEGEGKGSQFYVELPVEK